MCSDSVTWRAPTIDDAAAIHELHRAWADGLALPWGLSLDEITHTMAAPDGDLSADARVAENADGGLVAWVMVDHVVAEGLKHRGYVDVVSRPGHGHLERAAYAWGESRCREIFAAADDSLRRVIRASADDGDISRVTRLEELGFEVVRWFVDMIRPLDRAIPSLPPPDGVTIETWDDRWSHSAWQTHREAFADHWGSVAPTWKRWQHKFESPHFRPDLSIVAVAATDVVSYSLNAVFEHDWVKSGRRDGWIETLGTRRAWRGRGLASALLAESMRRFRAAGLDHAALDVDSANPTGAFGLYESLGFSESHRSMSLMKEIAV
jgi:mycothiol synthase